MSIEEEILTGFVRRSVISHSFEICEIDDFQAKIGCAVQDIIRLMMQNERLAALLPPLLVRLRGFPTEVHRFVNIHAIEEVVSGDVCIADIACTELFTTMSKYPSTWLDSKDKLQEFIRFVSHRITSTSIQLAEAATILLCVLVRDHANIAVMDTLLLIARQYSSDSTMALRYSALICNIAGSNDHLFQACVSAGGIDFVMGLCRTPDTLVQIVALETVEILLNTVEGLRYMISNGHIQWFVQESCSEDAILSSYTLRVAATFFFKISDVTMKSELLTESSADSLLVQLWGAHSSVLITQFLEAVKSHMDSTSDATRFAALSAISTFASSSLDALRYVAGIVDYTPAVESTIFSNLGAGGSSSHGGSSVLDAWMEMLRLKMDIQAAVLSSIATVMLSTEKFCRTEEDFARHAQSVLVILRQVGVVKNVPTMTYISKLAKQPVPIGKFAAFELFCSLARLSKGWGLDIILGHPECILLLLDQGSESTYEAKEKKFAVIEAITAHPSCEFLSSDVISKLRTIRDQGPHYLPSQLREMQTI